MLEKRPLTVEDLDREFAIELPDRELMAVVNQVALVAVGVAVDRIDVLNNSNVCVAAAVLGGTEQTCR
jgi:hypothetical protein